MSRDLIRRKEVRELFAAGATSRSSMSALFSGLLEGDHVDAPISDTARTVLDGHVFLSRELGSGRRAVHGAGERPRKAGGSPQRETEA